MIDASPRETLPKNLWPAPTSSSGPNVAGPGARWGGGACCIGACGGGACCGCACCIGACCTGPDCCARAGAVQHISAASVTAARREAKIIKQPLASKSGRRLNLTPTSKALGCVQCPLDSYVIGSNYDGTAAGKIWLAPRNSLFRPAGGVFRRSRPRFDGPSRDHRAGGDQPLFGTCDRGI